MKMLIFIQILKRRIIFQRKLLKLMNLEIVIWVRNYFDNTFNIL